MTTTSHGSHPCVAAPGPDVLDSGISKFSPSTFDNNTVIELVAADKPGLLSEIGQCS